MDVPRVCCVCSGFRVAWTIARFARSRDRAPPLASPSRVPGGAADGLVVGLAVESLGEERLGVDRRGDVLDLVFRGRRAHGASRLGGALRLGLPLRGRRAELRGEGGTESRHSVRWWCHARGAREAGRVAGWRVECATRRRARWLSWRAREPQSSQSGFRPRPAEHMSIQSAIVGPTRTKISPSAPRTRVSDSSSRNYPIRCMASSLRIRDFFTASQLERSRVKNAVRGRRRRGRQRATPLQFSAFSMTIARSASGEPSLRAAPLSRHSTHRNMAVMIGAPVRLVVRAATHVNPKATKGHTKPGPRRCVSSG